MLATGVSLCVCVQHWVNPKGVQGLETTSPLSYRPVLVSFRCGKTSDQKQVWGEKDFSALHSQVTEHR